MRIAYIQNFIIIACRILNPFTRIVVTKFKSHIFLKELNYLILGSLLFVLSCKSGTQALNETPTRGDIKIIADESFKPLIDTEVFTFTSIYSNAKIKASFKPEYDVINDFMADSVKVIVTSHKLTDDQIQYLRDSLIIARTTAFAYDALAIIINKENKDTLIKYNSIKDIFLGKAKKWKDIDPKSELGDISVIFDHTKSGNIRYFKELFEIKDTLGSNFYALKSNEEVVNFVSRNRDAMGIISVNWISDKDDSTSTSFTDKVTVAAISNELLEDNSYYRPQQGFIYDRSYPFVREIFFISRETFSGLGTGFIQWATGEQGQRIVLKSGLVPATMPIRLVQIRNE